MKKSIKNFLMRASVVLLAILLLVVQVNQANPLTAGFDRGEILTDETFTDVGGQYDVFHLLENVSVFSFGDTSGSHIVGPVLSNGMVSKINLDKKTVVDSIPETDLKQLLSLSTEKITVSDLNKGYPSYLGRISNAVGFEGNMRQFISEPNKIVDKIGNIYLGSEYQDGNIIHIKKTKGNGKDDPYKTEIKTLSGYVAIGGPGFVNPDFIDWETAFNEINAQSIQLLNNAKRIITTNDIVNHDGEMYLYVTPGEEVLVPKEIKFDTLGLVVGQENKEKGVFYNLERTIVSYEDSGRTYVKRVVLASDKNDKGSGFGQHAHQIHVPEHGGQTSHGYKYTPIDAGINLVLNYPYATQLVDINHEDQYGHIVAVNAQFAQFTGNSNGVKIVKDYLSPNTETHYWPYNYMAENADVEKVDIHLSKVWIGKVTNKVEVSLLADGETVTTVSFGESDNWKYTFKDLEKFDDNGNEIKYEIQETEIEGYYSDITGNSENGFIITNNELTSIKVNKKWVGNPLDSVTVNLLLDGKVIDSIGLSDSNEWHHSFDGLLKYDKEGEVLIYRIEELGYEGYTSEVVGDGNVYTITNTQNDNSKLTTLNVSKVWVGDINYDSVSVDLLANNEVIRTFDLSKQNDWKAEFEDLPLFDKDNNKIQYTFKEEKLVDYDVSYSSNDDGIHVITNTHKLINIEVEKQWEGNALDKINGTLTANGNVLYKFELSNTNQWNKVFLNLPIFDESHKQIEYEVTEDVYAGYLTDIEKVANKFTIKNTQKELNNLKVTKEWIGNIYYNSITVDLYADGVKVDTKKISKDNDWEVYFTNLPKYNDDNKLIEYEVKEIDVPQYDSTSKINPFDVNHIIITNTLKTKSVTVEKQWEGKPLDSVTVELLRNGVKITDVILSSENNWFYTFEGLTEFDEANEPYTYTMRELEYHGYKSTMTYEGDHFIFTNTELETRSINVKKNWIGDLYYDEITVNLLANEELVETLVLNSKNNWEGQFTNLLKYDDNDKEIIYSVKEVELTEYDVTYHTDLESNLVTITNTLKTVPISIEKVWNGKQLDNIEIDILQNNKTVDTVVLSELNGWKTIINHLPQYDREGNLYTYTVVEKQYEGYSSVITNNEFNFTVTNTEIETEKTNFVVSKQWIGDIYYNEIEVDVLANGKRVDTIILSEENGWEVTIDYLDKYDEDGNLIEYRVVEEMMYAYDIDYVYDVENSRITITNTLITTSVDIKKVWVGKQLDSIVVDLYQNGEYLESLVLDEKQNWEAQFKDLPMYDSNNNPFEYSVKESLDSDDYEILITGSMEYGFTITNTFIEDEDKEIPPTEPVDPEKPTVPEEPEKPEIPEEPTTPEESEKPTPPGIGDANRPDKPVEPVKPVPSEKPDLSKPNYGGTFNKDNMTSKDMLPPTGKTSTITFGSVLILLGYAILKKEEK